MEKQKISNSYTLDHFFRAAFSVNIVLLTFHDRKLKILIQEKNEVPFEKDWGLPGRLILPNEDSDIAMNELFVSLIGHSSFYKKQLATFSDITRHPLGRVVTFAYYGLIPYYQLEQINSSQLKLYELSKIPTLILDHNKIIKKVFKRFKKGLIRHPIVFEILPEQFIISDLISIYEQAFDRKVDVRNLRRKLLTSGLLKPLGENKKNKITNGRPAQLYTLNEIEDDKKDKILFELSIYLSRILTG